MAQLASVFANNPVFKEYEKAIGKIVGEVIDAIENAVSSLINSGADKELRSNFTQQTGKELLQAPSAAGKSCIVVGVPHDASGLTDGYAMDVFCVLTGGKRTMKYRAYVFSKGNFHLDPKSDGGYLNWACLLRGGNVHGKDVSV